jgi:NADH-quinone oxidoreductase subunit L
MEYSYAYLILLLPFLSFLLLGLFGMKMKKPVAGLIGTFVVGTLFALSLYTAYEYFFVIGRDAATGLYPTVTPFNFTWLDFGKAPLFGTQLLFKIGFRLTPISVMMLVVITTVSFMVHIYSFGYMSNLDEHYHRVGYQKGFQRFYAFLSLFTMSMLGLVVATNLFQMYLFWELVGICSYLLIGFYYPKHAAVHASKKAFIVTRFADLFFLIGILFYSFYVGTFNYDLGVMPDLTRRLAGASWVIPAALFLMFIGGAGKSAMFPLHIWLPDAMEGSYAGQCFDSCGYDGCGWCLSGRFSLPYLYQVRGNHPTSLDCVDCGLHGFLCSCSGLLSE